jgi:uncharacterized protein (DUF2267 family)
MTQPRDVLYASKLYQEWLGELKERALLHTHNQSQAIFRAVLHGLREHMTTEQVLTFADALPPLPRGIFIEGWRPGRTSPCRSASDFLGHVVVNLAPHVIPPSTVVDDVLAIIAKHVEPRDSAIMREQLPDVLKPLWPAR